MRVHRLPFAPGIFFNALSIQAAMPRDVTAVLYQSFTPPWSRAARAVLVHDLIYLTRPDFFTSAERAYFDWIVRLLPRAEAIATVSAHVREQVLELFPRRDPATVSVIPNGVDERFFTGRASPPVIERRPYVLAVGRINPRKNLARLVRALDLVQPGGVDLVLAGPAEGPRDTELERALADVKATRVVRLGHVADEVLPGLYAGAEIACYVSLDEGFGVPPLEAMASGTPVLGSDIPAIREVVADAALLVDPTSIEAIANGLTTLLADQTRRDHYVDAGRRRVERFRWTRTADAAISVLRAATDIRT